MRSVLEMPELCPTWLAGPPGPDRSVGRFRAGQIGVGEEEGEMKGKILKMSALGVIILMILVGFSAIPTIGCDDDNCCQGPCVPNKTVDLWIAQVEDSDWEIYIKHDADELKVIFRVKDGEESDWYITESHVAVSTYLDGIPQTKSGSPKVGKFLSHVYPDEPSQEVTHTILWDDIVVDGIKAGLMKVVKKKV